MPAKARAAYVAHIASAPDLGFKTVKRYQGEFRDAADAAKLGKAITQLTQLMPACLVVHVGSTQRGREQRHSFDALVASKDRTLKAQDTDEDALARAEALKDWILEHPGWQDDTNSYVLADPEEFPIELQHLMTAPAFAVYRVGITFDQMPL